MITGPSDRSAALTEAVLGAENRTEDIRFGSPGSLSYPGPSPSRFGMRFRQCYLAHVLTKDGSRTRPSTTAPCARRVV